MTIGLAADSAELRKARGAFFTPPEVTRFICDWAITSPTDRVLEPSCGDGAFLSAAALRMATLGGRVPLRAYELDLPSAEDARCLLKELGLPGEVLVGDFLAAKAEAAFDVVVGNPPYIRYQGFTGEARASGLAAALAQGVRLSKLASSWAPFVIHSAGFLAPGGRLALVLPAELLTANYAQEVRDFLLQRFSQVKVILMGGQVFAGVQTEALLLLAEGSGGTGSVSFASIEEAGDLKEVRFHAALEVGPGERWSTALVSSPAQRQLATLAESGHFTTLSQWGRLSLGAVTGNNRFFTMSPAMAQGLGLTTSDVVPISPPGSSHLRALALTEASHAALGQTGARTLLFRPESPTAAALEYIAHGEQMGVQDAYKCRVRNPWWRTPLPASPDLFFTYMNHETPQLAANRAQLHYLNSVHGVYLTPDAAAADPEVLALAALNSATSLSAEITGRAYGGGILKMEPREASRLLVPSISAIRAHHDELLDLLPGAKRLLRAGSLAEVRNQVDGVLLKRREVAPVSLEAMREAYGTLSQRRHDRARCRPAKEGTT